VINVSWPDAKAYVAWLSKKTGKDYRLPSEAEWEYAARAGSELPLASVRSESDLCRYANHEDLTYRKTLGFSADCSDGYLHTAPVGSFPANNFGLHDMQGNVWEWVEDCYQDEFNSGWVGAPSDGSAWTTGSHSDGSARMSCEAYYHNGDWAVRRVKRGGGWSAPQWMLRVTYRLGESNDNRLNHSGFRVARAL
jgi:formylglycine-generating enzyme required for sulfatase activity